MAADDNASPGNEGYSDTSGYSTPDGENTSRGDAGHEPWLSVGWAREVGINIGGRLYVPSPGAGYLNLDMFYGGAGGLDRVLNNAVASVRQINGQDYIPYDVLVGTQEAMRPFARQPSGLDKFIESFAQGLPLTLGLGVVGGGISGLFDGITSAAGAAGGGIGGGAGGIGLSAADIAGLTQMGVDAGLSGAALDAFVANGGAASLGSGLAAGSSLSAADRAGLTQMGMDAGLSGAELDAFVESGGAASLESGFGKTLSPGTNGSKAPAKSDLLTKLGQQAARSAASSAVTQLLSGGGTSVYDPSADLAAQEQRRQEARRNATNNIDAAFSGFDDAYYRDYENTYLNKQRPLLDEQFQEAARGLPLNMASTASSAYARRRGNLERDYDRAKVDIYTQAADAAASQRGNVENARSTLFNQASLTGMDSASDQAASVAKSLNQPPAFSPLGDMFAKYTANMANARTAADLGYKPVRPLLFGGTGGRNSYTMTSA